MESTPRKRSGSFLQDDDDEDVQFLTPHYGGGGGVGGGNGDDGPEPVDFSKLELHLDGDEQEDEEGFDEDEEERQQELIISRGRSRSRSVHEYDDNNNNVLPDNVSRTSPPKTMNAEQIQQELEKRKLAEKNASNGPTPPVDRTGPLQHREVVALQKGLEEATQSLNKTNSREDEEEKMAADAEKRKRLLAAANHLPTKDAEPARRIKLLLLGDSGVGKSSLIMRWTLDSFSPSLTSTVGVNFKSKKINYHGELMQVQVWDTAGQENFHKITTSYYKGAQGIMLVYDVSDQKSLDNVEYWIKNIKSHASDSVQVVLVGNKIDLRQTIDPSTNSPIKCVDVERGKEIAKKFSVPFFEASAKDSSHVDEAFITLVHNIVEMSVPKHHLTVRASLQGLDRKSIDIRANSVPNANNSPPNHALNKDAGNCNTNGAVGASTGSTSAKESKSALKSLGLKKSPERVANGQSVGGGGAGTGEEKEKCILS